MKIFKVVAASATAMAATIIAVDLGYPQRLKEKLLDWFDLEG